MVRILVVGCGYAGARIAARHLARGDAVTGAGRRFTVNQNVEPLPLDLDAPLPRLPAVDRVYYTAPPPAEGRSDGRLAAFLDALPPPASFVYFGTTGVYGDHAGNRVDETSSLNPGTDRAQRRLDAERQVAAWCERQGSAAALLRIAGIYGPGRLPLARLRAGEPVPDPADTGPGNRIHVDDLVAAAIAVADALENGTPGGAWNVSDGNPLSVAEFSELVARAAGLPQPRRVPLASPEVSAGLRGFLRESRCVDNRKLLSLVGFSLQYRDPADGIRQSLDVSW